MNSLRHRTPAIALVLALLLGFSSLLPFWTGGEAAAAAGAGHAAMHHHSSAVDTGPAEPVSTDTCPQHKSCSGQCCVGCAQCVMALSVSPHVPVATSPDFRATELRLTLDVSSSSLERPPRD